MLGIKAKLMCNVPLWIPTPGHTSVSRKTKIYICSMFSDWITSRRLINCDPGWRCLDVDGISLWILVFSWGQLARIVEYTDAPLQGSKTPPNKCPGYDTKQSDGEASIMLELLGMQSTPFIAIALWPGMVAPNDRVQSMGQTELFDI